MREGEVSLLMDSLHQPLLYSIVLVLGPELLHLLSGTLWDHLRLLNVLPKCHLVQVVSVVRAHD